MRGLYLFLLLISLASHIRYELVIPESLLLVYPDLMYHRSILPQEQLLAEITNSNSIIRQYSASQFVRWITEVSSLKIDKEAKRYIWEDADECEKICKKIQSVSQSRHLIYRYQYGGFGNMLYSYITTMLMSFSIQRGYRIVYPQYDELFDNCIASAPQVDPFNCNHYKPKMIGNVYNCDKLLSYFTNKDVMIDVDFLYYPSWLNCGRMNDRRLLSLNNTILSDGEISRVLLKILINPKKDVRQAIQLCEKIIFQRKHKIGLQLRFGGKRAATPEAYEGVPWSRLPDVAKQIEGFLLKRQYLFNETVVYVSSDSEEAVEELQKAMNSSLLVLDSPLFAYGHSDKSMHATSSYVNIMNRIIADFYFMERSDFMFVTWQSSLGRMMCNMKKKGHCLRVLNNRSTDKKQRIK